MDPVRTLLDRELLLSGLVHELRGPITAVQGFVELEESPRPGLEAAVERLTGLVDILAETQIAEPVVAMFCGTTIRCKGPPEVLERALSLLPHRSITVEVHADYVALAVGGVPAAEQAAGWSLAQVRGWLEQGGPGFAGARLRVAARIVGALRYSFVVPAGGTEGVVYIHLPRG